MFSPLQVACIIHTENLIVENKPMLSARSQLQRCIICVRLQSSLLPAGFSMPAFILSTQSWDTVLIFHIWAISRR